MKKTISMLLILAAVFCLCACGGKNTPAPTAPAAESAPVAAAAEISADAEKSAVTEQAAAPQQTAKAMPISEAFDASACGFRYVYPEEYQNASGIVRMMKQSASSDSAVYELTYILLPEEEHAAFLEYEKTLGADGLTLSALYEKGYSGYTIFLIYADRVDGNMAKKIENDMIQNAAEEGMIYVGQTKASSNWYCSLLRPDLYEKEPDNFRASMGDAFDEFISFARNKELALSGFTAIS